METTDAQRLSDVLTDTLTPSAVKEIATAVHAHADTVDDTQDQIALRWFENICKTLTDRR